MSKIKKIREKNNINKIDMCKILHMSETSYSKKESDVGNMKLRDVIKICKFLNCEINDIYDCNENESNSKLKSLYILENKIEFKSYIYFLKDTNRGLIKIGKTNGLSYRISQIRGCMVTAGIDANELKLVGIYPVIQQDADLVEREFYIKFKDYRCFGEWFKIDETDIGLNEIKKILGVKIFVGETECEIDTKRDWIGTIDTNRNIENLCSLEELKIKTMNDEKIKKDIYTTLNLL